MTDRPYAVHLYNHALGLIQTDPAMAYRSAISAVTVDSSFAAGWLLLSNLLSDMGNLKAAISALHAARRCPDDGTDGGLTEKTHHKILVNLGHRLMRDGQLREAKRFTNMAIDWPYEADIEGRGFAHTNMSLLLSLEGEDASAVTYAGAGFEMCPDILTEMALAFALLFNGEYAEGLQRFEARIPYKLRQFLNMPWPRWDGTRVGVLVVISEQGLGDCLSFARFVPEAANMVDQLIFQVQPELVELLTIAVAQHRNIKVVPHDHVLPEANAWCPIVSLPLALQCTDYGIANWPGLDLDFLDLKGFTDSFPKDSFNIAIVWAGAPVHDNDRHRSIPVHEFLALREVPGVKLWSVQVGPRSKDMHDIGAAALIHDCSPWIKDAADTAAILDRCDLVVTCDSFVGHLAGALNQECWLLCSYLGRDWRLGNHGDTPIWYPRTRLFRQGDDHQWEPVFRRVVEALKARMEKHDAPV